MFKITSALGYQERKNSKPYMHRLRDIDERKTFTRFENWFQSGCIVRCCLHSLTSMTTVEDLSKDFRRVSKFNHLDEPTFQPFQTNLPIAESLEEKLLSAAKLVM